MSPEALKVHYTSPLLLQGYLAQSSVVTVLTMKVILVLLGLITTTVLTGMSWLGTVMITREELRELGTDCAVLSTQLTGVAAVTVRIRAYNAIGNIIPEHKDAFILGTRVLLTCDVTELPEGSEVVSYRWFHNCTGNSNNRCEIGDGDPYYRVVSDTLLVDVISQDQGGRYYCFVTFSNIPQSSHFTTNIKVAG